MRGLLSDLKPLTIKETQFVPIGPNYGVGAAFGWWIPSAVVKMLKSKNMFFPNAIKVRTSEVQHSFRKRSSSKDEHAPNTIMLTTNSLCRL